MDDSFQPDDRSEYLAFQPLRDTDRSKSLIGRFEEVAAAFPERVAITSEYARLTYRELNELANRLAHAILAVRGPEPEPVALLMPHRLETVAAMLGVMKAGKSYVPIDPYYPPAWITHILDDIQASLVVTDHLYMDLAMSSLADPAAVTLLQWEKLDPHLPSTNTGITPKPEDVAYLLFTSGSTGKPKGAIHTNLDVMNNMVIQTIDLEITPDVRSSVHVTFGFEVSRFALYSPLLNGGAACLYDIRGQGLNGLAEWMGSESLTLITSTPSTFRHMLTLDPDPAWFSQVRIVVLGGETVSIQDVNLFNQYFPSNSILVNVLGMTETGIICRYKHTHGAYFEGLSLPAGQPLGDKRLLLLDENNEPVPEGEVGELYLTTQYLIPGYWRLPNQTADRIWTDPQDPKRKVFRTGDLGRMRLDSNLEYLGRKDSQIKIRGYRVDPAEIEGVIHQFGRVRNTAVIARDMKRGEGDRQLVAYIEIEPGLAVNKAAIRDFLSARLPNYMVPPVIVFIDSLPLTPTGKINRQALPEPEAIGQGTERVYTPARDGVEMQLVSIWEKVLKASRVSINDDYFELGGNSLLAAQLFAAIEKTFGRKLPLATLFQAPTIEGQAAILRSDTWTPDWSSLILLRAGKGQPPLFFAAPVGGNVLSYRDLMVHLNSEWPIYGLQALGLDGTQSIQRNVNDIADHYVKEILAVQPEGPYHLLGSSFGGLVSYEIAQRLHDRDLQVGLVVMFDAYGPGYPRRLPSTNRLRRKIYKYARRIDTHVSNLRYTDWKGRMIYVRVKLPRLFARVQRRIRNKLDSILHPLPPELRRVRSAHMGAARRKKRQMREPRRFSGRLVLFRAEKQPLGIYSDPNLGWASLVGENLEVIEVPGHHTSIIYEPRVPVLADHLNRILQEISDGKTKI